MAGVQQQLQAIGSVIIALLLLPKFLLVALYQQIFSGHGKRLNGKTVLITGAGNGLGREMARQLAQLDCKVLCLDMRKEDLEDTVQMINERNVGKNLAKAYVCDITNTAQVAEVRDSVLKEFGKVDILINNAAFLFLTPFMTGSDEHVQRIMDVNVLGATWMTRAFLPSMMEHKSGHLVYISSMAGLTVQNGATMYSVSKHALSALAAGVDEELRSQPEYKDIKVSAAHPWFTATHPAYKDLYRTNMSTLSLKFTAESVLDGVRREYSDFQIPGGQFSARMTLLMARVMPKAAMNIIRSGLKTEIAVITDSSIFKNFAAPSESLLQFQRVDKSIIKFVSDEK